jgi:predicted esterase
MKELAGITFQEYGKSDVPIICIHGIGGDSDSFKPQLEALRQDFRIISLNLPDMEVLKGYRKQALKTYRLKYVILFKLWKFLKLIFVDNQ